MDAAHYLTGLVAKEIRTVTGKPNTVLAVTDTEAIVATRRSPNGKPVPIADVQAAIDTLMTKGEITVDVDTLGYRSAFIGAVLATLPGAIVLPTSPQSIILAGTGSVPHR